MLKAIIGGVEYPVAQYKLRELSAAGPALDRITDLAVAYRERGVAAMEAKGLVAREDAMFGPATATETAEFMRAPPWP